MKCDIKLCTLCSKVATSTHIGILIFGFFFLYSDLVKLDEFSISNSKSKIASVKVEHYYFLH